MLFRLAPGITIDSAEAALDGITRRLDKDDPFASPQQDKAKRVVLLPAGTRLPIPRDVHPKITGFYLMLMVIVTAIACLNLATMVLARAQRVDAETAIASGATVPTLPLVLNEKAARAL